MGKFLVIGLVGAALTSPLEAATTIFGNSVTDLEVRFDPGALEVGDQIVLAGTERYLTYFDFEYWGVNTLDPGGATFAGAVEARVRFYLNDGALFNGYATPGTMFYDSGWFGGFPATDYYPYRQTLYFQAGVDFPSGGLFIPDDEMTWTIQFQGMGASDTVGVDLFSPPVVGQDYPDYWENNGGWALMTNGVPVNFAATMEAIVPEPSSLALSVVGGLVTLALARRRRRDG